MPSTLEIMGMNVLKGAEKAHEVRDRPGSNGKYHGTVFSRSIRTAQHARNAASRKHSQQEGIEWGVACAIWLTPVRRRGISAEIAVSPPQGIGPVAPCTIWMQ